MTHEHPLGEEFFENKPWPDPKELQPELPPVPEFNLNHLPEPLRPLVEEVSEGMQVPYDFPACAAIAALAGCVGHRAVVVPKQLDCSWKLVCNLWGVIIASPGFMKTPVLKLIMRPLESIERGWREVQQADEEEHERLKQQIKLEMEVYEQAAKAAMKAGRPLPPRPDDKLWAPNERRLLITDCTFEMLHQIQSANPAGILQVRDELTGFFTGLEREGRQGEREYWLQCWSGDSGFSVDRIGRGSIYVPYACASLFGNCVPNKLRYYLTSILSGGATDDGMIQRFQNMCWPDTPRGWKYIDKINNSGAAGMAEHVYQSLVRLNGKFPLELRFDCESQKLFVAWLTDLELRLRSDTLNPAMASHLLKYKKLMPVLAGIFQLSECAQRGELETRIIPEPAYATYARRIVLEDTPPAVTSEATPISAANTLRSTALCEYFEAHARRVYSCIISPEIRAGHALARHIKKKGDLDAQFSRRDIDRKCWTDLNTAELINAALIHLAELNWIRQLEMPASPKGGRPSEIWSVNPKVLKKD